MSRRTGGRPGDRIDGRPVKVTIHSGPRPKNHLLLEVLRRPVETAQFTSTRYGERLAKIGAVPSIGTVGDSFNNALAETVNGSYKAKLIRGPARQGPWRSVEEVELATLGWVHWHNTARLHGYLGDVPPVEFEAAFYAAAGSDPLEVELLSLESL